MTQLKQSQIRQLKTDLNNLRSSLAKELASYEADFRQKTEGPLLTLAGQLQTRIVEKEEQMESLSAKLNNVLE